MPLEDFAFEFVLILCPRLRLPLRRFIKISFGSVLSTRAEPTTFCNSLEGYPLIGGLPTYEFKAKPNTRMAGTAKRAILIGERFVFAEPLLSLLNNVVF